MASVIDPIVQLVLWLAATWMIAVLATDDDSGRR